MSDILIDFTAYIWYVTPTGHINMSPILPVSIIIALYMLWSLILIFFGEGGGGGGGGGGEVSELR